jgi:hypothetical protein
MNTKSAVGLRTIQYGLEICKEVLLVVFTERKLIKCAEFRRKFRFLSCWKLDEHTIDLISICLLGPRLTQF